MKKIINNLKRQIAETLGVVHTHTHTHTGILKEQAKFFNFILWQKQNIG